MLNIQQYTHMSRIIFKNYKILLLEIFWEIRTSSTFTYVFENAHF